MKNEMEILFNLMRQWRFCNISEIPQNDAVLVNEKGEFLLVRLGGKRVIQMKNQNSGSNTLIFPEIMCSSHSSSKLSSRTILHQNIQIIYGWKGLST